MKKCVSRMIEMRRENGFTQAYVAKVVQRQRSTISGYESGAKEPDLETFCRLADLYGVSADYLLGRTDDRDGMNTVVCGDKVGFRDGYNMLPRNLQIVIDQLLDSIYTLLLPDVNSAGSQRLYIYRRLFKTLQTLRGSIREIIAATAGGKTADMGTMSEMMALQSELKNNTAALLDELMQADIEIGYGLKKDTGTGSESKSAI